MRLLLIAPVALCMGAAPAPPEPQPPASLRWVMPTVGAPPPACPDTPMSLARKQMDKPQLRRLDELPDAQAFAAVDRRVSGCPAPVLLGQVSGR